MRDATGKRTLSHLYILMLVLLSWGVFTSSPAHAEETLEEVVSEDHSGQKTGHEDSHGEGHEAWIPPLWGAVPFLVMLLAVAVFPLLPKISHWWENNTNRLLVCCILGIPVIIWVLQKDPHRLEHTAIEYFSFIVLLASLFVAAGGLHVKGDLRATPSVNTTILAIGYCLASVIGTTGASMLLIYPLLRTNSERKKNVHVFIFFIFLVSNTGGLLSPIGDPPLFLGYLKGIDFFWFLKLSPMWLANGIILLALFWFLDRWYYSQEAAKDLRLDDTQVEPIRLIGVWNIFFLLVIVVSVVISKQLEEVTKQIFGHDWKHGATPIREIIMILAVMASLLYAKQSPVAKDARKLNNFSFHAIIEVGVVFFGIFATMMPTIALLSLRGRELHVDSPLKYFYATGVFSSFLDNAPTFVCFLALGQGVAGFEENQAEFMMRPEFNEGLGYSPALILAAISLGAVFMGAVTYIGNAPNFMVRAIAEEQGIKMPNFFGFMLWAIVILIPVFSLIAYFFLVRFSFPLF